MFRYSLLSFTTLAIFNCHLFIGLDCAEAQNFSDRFSGGSQFGSGTTGGSTQNNSNAGQLTGGERFLEENRQGAFVGSDSGDTTNARSQAGNGGGNFGGNNAFGGGNNPFSQLFGPQGLGGLNNQQSNEPQVRVRISVGFTPEKPAQERLISTWNNRLSNLPALKDATIDIQQQDGAIVLSGEVASEHEKRLAERIMLFEPGVSHVLNRLTVKAPVKNGE